MTYDIYIGKGRVDAECEALDPRYAQHDGRQLTARWVVDETTHWNAPQFPVDELTGITNGRHSGYSQWDNFTKEAGLHDLFFANNPFSLMYNHPGCALITPEALQAVANARYRRQLAVGLPPGFVKYDWVGNQYVPQSDPDLIDAILARLLWLEGWMNWAYRNYPVPALCNF